ncbi:hypothetical protein, partial [Stenotrophomonas maltophilia]
LHKIPAHTFKDLGKWPQRRSRVLRSFLRSEAAHYARLFQSVNTFVRSSRSAVVGTLLSLKPFGGDPCDGGGEVCPYSHRL